MQDSVLIDSLGYRSRAIIVCLIKSADERTGDARMALKMSIGCKSLADDVNFVTRKASLSSASLAAVHYGSYSVSGNFHSFNVVSERSFQDHCVYAL